jgi:hypothetical protein
MILTKLKPGMTVYEVRQATGVQRFNGPHLVYPVIIREIDAENERIKANWNMNPAEWFHKNRWSKWRLKHPIGIKKVK